MVEPDAERRRELQAQHPGLSVVGAPEPVILGGRRRSGSGRGGAGRQTRRRGVRLPVVGRVRPVTRLLSIVAGIPSARIEAALGGEPAVVRAMPNTPALVGAGVTAISGGSFATSADFAWAEGSSPRSGTVVRLPERLLDAVTGLSGSGPAYFFLVAEALMEAGVQMGLPRDVSRTLVVETMAGSAALLAETGRRPSPCGRITSPVGTTAAGLRASSARAVRSALMEAVATATERARSMQR